MDRQTLIAEHRALIAARLDPLIAAGSRCALVDFPSHSNVGDSAIWAGERAYLRAREAKVTYTCDPGRFREDALLAARPDTILIHGGGNFGDLYPRHQQFREHLVERFGDRTIVQLPQTLHFSDRRSLERAGRVFSAHPDVTLLWRDERSLAVARETFDHPSLLCPDMAMFLGPLPRPHAPSSDVVWLARTDQEAAGDQRAGTDVRPVDWLTTETVSRWSRLGLADRARRRLSRRVGAAPSARPWTGLLSATFDPLAAAQVRRGAGLLSAGRTVVTDRLHAHLLSLLLGIPHVVYGDAHGKVRGYHDAWTRDADLVRWADSPEEAMRLADGLARA